MKIGDIRGLTSQALGQYEKNSGMNKTDSLRADANQAASKSAGSLASPELEVAFSAQSKDFVQIKNAVAKLPDVREEKVQGLKSQIENGSYQVDSAKVAEAMVKESLLDIFA